MKEKGFNYDQYKIDKDKELFCNKCGQSAIYIRYGYAWCEEHKELLKQDPEALEIIVIERLKELGL